ncbi:Flp family type IVb pilin [Actinoplanes sp. TFC3]|uniref:Flp family type IVb pilin n=1 Tax=Actinoplanes sp. TFC3 TaxID=1710355 RepID=UPI0009E8C30C|nr:Flp family type IVb pilin [Actinoplanes sp. TFC3]
MLIILLREMARRWPSHDDEGATAVEYALLVGLIAVIIISSVTLLGGNIDAMFDDVANQLGGGTDDGS